MDGAAGKALLRVLLASLLCTAVCKKFEMNGRCAAVVKLQKWMKEDLFGDGETANWDYKIKVDPWTVFGQVHVHLKGKRMRLEHVYGGTAPVGGSSFAVALAPVPLGDDNLFEISGLGEPDEEPEFTCSNLLRDEDISTCPLGIHFKLNALLQPDVLVDARGNTHTCKGDEIDPATGALCSPGMFTTTVRMDMWIEGSEVTLDFGTRGVMIKDLWNSRMLSGGDGKSTSATFKLKKQDGSWFGERKEAFGFAADGIITKLPSISCVVTKPFPAPPPPRPPAPPPKLPPFFLGDRSGCFLGGNAVFTHAPDSEPVLGWMHSFEVTVTLGRWQAGAMVLLDFYGKDLHEHPLKVLSADPAEALHREDVTGHSLMVKLLPSPVNEFKVVASGAVEGTRTPTPTLTLPLTLPLTLTLTRTRTRTLTLTRTRTRTRTRPRASTTTAPAPARAAPVSAASACRTCASLAAGAPTSRATPPAAARSAAAARASARCRRCRPSLLGLG